MPFGLPARDEANWDTKLNDSINAVKATADAAQPSATLDASVTAVDADAASALRVQQDARLSATYVPAIVISGAGIDPSGAATSHVAIQAKIAAAGVNGKVHYPAGTYTLGATLDANVAGQTWTFDPGAELVLANAANSDTITISADDVTLVHPRIDGNRTNQTGGSGGILVTGDNVTIESPVITNVRTRPINVTGTKPAIRNGDFSDFAEAAIAVVAPAGTSLSGVQATGNRIHTARTGAYGILIHGTTPDITDSSRISDNDITLPVGASEGLCIEVYGLSPHSTITGNVCRGGQMGISASDADSSSITGNVVIGPALYGIEVAASEHVTVTGNAVDGNSVTDRLISCSNATLGHLAISGNTLHDWDAAGYAIRVSGANFLTITGNDLDGPNQPIYLASCDHYTIQGNTADGAGTSADAVNLDTCGGGVVSGNSWHNFTRSGVCAYTGSMAGQEIGPNQLSSTPLEYKPFTALGAGTIVRGQRGTTAARPAATEVGDGADYYDTTLNKPIWSDGAGWKDATGTAA